MKKYIIIFGTFSLVGGYYKQMKPKQDTIYVNSRDSAAMVVREGLRLQRGHALQMRMDSVLR